MRPGHHWVKKNPDAPRFDLLWHRHRYAALLRLVSADRETDQVLTCAMAVSSSALGTEAATEYLLLHRNTGTALYAT